MKKYEARDLPPTQRCPGCNEKVVLLRPDGEAFQAAFGQTIEIGQDVLLAGASKAYMFETRIGHAFQPLAEETAQLVEVLVLHQCPRRR